MGRYIYDEFGNKLRFKGTPIHNSYSGAKQRCNYKLEFILKYQYGV